MHDTLIVAAHHPDRVRWPARDPRALGRDLAEQTKLWNVFRALELVSPAFWLRRLHARAFGAPLTPAPQLVDVSLWRTLTMPPSSCLDGAQPSISIDVWIETEHAVWTLLSADRLARGGPNGAPDPDLVSRAIEASAWHAGGRQHYTGIIEGTHPFRARVLTQIPRVVHWTDLAGILSDCADAAALGPVERFVARQALDWLRQAGLSPLAASAL